MKIQQTLAALVLAATTLTGCGIKQTVVTNNGTAATVQVSDDNPAEQLSRQKLAFVQKVSDNALYQQNVVSKLSFTLQTGSKNITVPGSIHMRKDDVIRIQLFVPLLGTEVGRLEFTKDYVMIVDRIHKQYIKGDYNKVSFLSERSINFYSLQALFWNQLFLPGAQKLSESQLRQFDVDLAAKGSTQPVELRQGNMTFRWSAEKNGGRIETADITYSSTGHGTTTLNWKYDDFRAFGSKLFPHEQLINFKTGARDIKVTLDMNGVSAESDWEPRTTVSDKYKEVGVEDVLKQLMTL